MIRRLIGGAVAAALFLAPLAAAAQTSVIIRKQDNSGPAVLGNQPYTPTDVPGTIAAANTLQLVFAANPARVQCSVGNPVSASEPLMIYYQSGTPTLSHAFPLAPGSTFFCAGNGTVILTAVYAAASTLGHTFTGSGS